MDKKLETFKKENPAVIRYFKNNRTQFHLLNIKLDEFSCDMMKSFELEEKKYINTSYKNLYHQHNQFMLEKYAKVL